MKKSVVFGLFTVAALAVLAGFSYGVTWWFSPTDSTCPSLWANFWAAFNNVVLAATLIVVAYYTYETHQLRKATVDSNALSFRPILIFDAGAPFCTVKNKGNGPALNTCLIIWDGSKMKVAADNTIPGIMPVGNDAYCFNTHIEIDSAGFKEKLPGFSSLTERICSTKHALFCLTYRDVAGNKFYSIINGSNQTNYEGVFEHGQIHDA